MVRLYYDACDNKACFYRGSILKGKTFHILTHVLMISIGLMLIFFTNYCNLHNLVLMSEGGGGLIYRSLSYP